MAKQLNVDLNLRANTLQAKLSILELLNKLSLIANMPISGPDKLKLGLLEASNAAKELLSHIINATNVNTGKLDMGKFSLSLKKSNADLSLLTTKLISAGATGELAFVALANSLAQADRHAISLGTRLGGLMTTLKNTARWQISSSILHGFMGAIQGAYGYAQDLNRSLNNIRIVTGLSTDLMAAFAKEANNAAKALSTSTLNYTDAALIYYQLGIRDLKEIEQRTTTTIKLANVSRLSAEEVSSEMTAIWNNFAKGGKNLEYYADVITALGAATASSSQEIAAGLLKFASVADTVGLSYEKASAALATIVAVTRLSEDVVGTALKTIFARVDSLKLGETLEDGVSLNKYAKALETVGVNILDSNLNLKDMDTILDELGNKWSNISEAQKVALAETVAGQRQYALFMALMNNYDQVLANQLIAQTSSGTLQKLQEIYAESWEAASKRVKASLQGIYLDLINDKFFISLSNGFAQVVDGLHKFIENLGGIKPLFIGLSGLILSSISGKIIPAILSLRLNLTTLFITPKQLAQEYSDVMTKLFDLKTMAALGLNLLDLSPVIKNTIMGTSAVADAKNKLMIVEKLLSAEEQKRYGSQMALIEAYKEQTAVLAQKVVEEQENLEKTLDSMNTTEATAALEKLRKAGLDELIAKENEAKIAWQSAESFGDLVLNYEAYIKAGQAVDEYRYKTDILIATQDALIEKIRLQYEESIKLQETDAQLASRTVDLSDVFVEITNNIDQTVQKMSQMNESQIGEAFKDLRAQLAPFQNLFPLIKKALDEMLLGNPNQNQLKQRFLDLSTLLKTLKIDGTLFKAILLGLGDGTNVRTLEEGYKNLHAVTQQLTDSLIALNNATTNFNPLHIMTGTEALTKMAGAGMLVHMVISSLKSAFSTLNSDASGLEKFSAILMALGMSIPATILIFKGFKSVIASFKAELALATIEQQVFNLALDKATMSAIAAAAAKTEDTHAEIANIVATKLGLTEDAKKLLIQNLENKEKSKGSKLTAEEITSTVLLTLTKGAEEKARWGNVKAMLAEKATALLVIGAIVAVIAIATIAIKKMQEAREADRKSAQNATKAARELEEAYESTKQAYEDLKSTISNYDSAKEALDTLTEGTREWRDKLREANNEARQLIETYPELAKYSHYTSLGLLEISQEGLDEALEKLSLKVSESMSSTILAKANAEVLSARVDVTDLKNSLHWRNLGTDIASTIGYLAPIPGLAVVPSIFNAAASAHDSKIDKAIDEAVQAYAENAELVGKTDTLLAEMFNVTSDLIPKIRELGEATRLATENMAASTKEALVALYEGNSDINNASAIADIVAGTGRLNSKEFLKLVAQYTAAAADRGIFNTGTSVSKEVWDEYAKYLEEELGYELVKATNFKGDGTVEYSYVDDQGQVQTKQTATAETIGTTVATAEYNKQQELLGEEFAEITKNLNQESMEALSLVARRVNGEFASEEDKWRYIELMNSGRVSFSSLDISDWAKLATGNGAISAEMRTGRDIYNRLIEDMGLNDEILLPYLELKKALDIRKESATAVSALSKVKTALKEVMTTEDWAEIDNQLQIAGIKNISSESLKGLTYEQLKNVLDTAYRSLLESMVKASLDAINQGQKTISARERQALEILNSPQWELGEGLITFGKNAARERYQLLLSKDRSEVVKEGLANIFNPENYVKTIENPLYERFGLGPSPLSESSEFDIKDYVKGVQKSIKDLNLSPIVPDKQDGNVFKNLQDARKQILEEAQKNGFTPSFSNLNNPFDTLDEAIFYTDENFNKIYSSFLEDAEKEYENFEQNNTLPWFKELLQKIENLQIESLKKQVEEALAEYQKAINTYNSETIRASATLQELDNNIAYGNSLFEEGWLKTGDYSLALISMASNYENAADEVAKFNLALSLNDEELLNAAENSLRLSIRVGELAELYGLTAEDVEMLARLIQTLYLDLGQDISGEAAAEMAGRNQRLNRGVKTLSENFESWNKVLQTADSLSTEYAEALNNTYEALADLTGAIDAAHIPLDFLNKQAKSGASRLDLMAKAAEGDQEAIRELNYELARTTFENLDYLEDVLELTDDNDSIVTNIIGDPAVFEETKNRILQTIDELYNAASGYDIGQNLTDEKWANLFIQDLNEIAAATGMTVEEMNSYLSQIGVDIPVETTYIELTRELPEYVTHHRYTAGKLGEGETGIAIDDYSWTEASGKINTAKERIPVAKIGKNAKITYTGGGSVGGISTSSTSGGSSGSSSSTPKRESTKNTSDETERYHVINKETDQLTKAYDRLNTAKDRAFGANRLKLMDAEIANTKKQIALNKEYINQAKSYAQLDYNNLLNGKQNAYTIDGLWYLSEGLRGLGIELQLDENGVIQNYDEIMAAATARYNERIATYNTNPENSNLKEIADAEFNSIKELISQYEESNELVQDKLDNNQKLINQLQDLNLEQFNYKLELKFKINEREKKRIEFELRQIGDDAFKSAEALSKIFSTDGSPSQWSIALDELNTYEKSFSDLNDLYKKGEVSEAGYIEGLEKVSDGIYEQLETVLDLKDTMEDYYSNTLSKLKEKYDELRTAMSHTTEVLEHLKTVLSLSGRGQDFAATGALLEAEAEAQANAYDVSKANYEKDVRLFKQREKELTEARKNGGKELIKIAEENYKAAREAMNASELDMYNDLESWLQTRWSLIENATASTADLYGKMMTDGMGFDYLNLVMTLSEKTLERYLTKTNQIYETEKLRRKLQQDLDKTTNAAAKQRIALFDRELQTLREKNELSKTELSLAQGRYELLLAQIALEEAQNAKTTVRLLRDAEGNYGYVYTADQNAIAEAEQNAADAENNLYNTAREAQNELVKEMFTTLQEYSQAIADLWNNQELSTKEKQLREIELRTLYNDQMSKLAEELGIADIALATWSATGVNDTWTATYTGLAKRQTEFNADSEALWDELRVYLVGEDGKGGAFKIISDAANNVLGVSLTDLKIKTNNLIAENKKLKEELVGADGKGGLVKATEDEADAVAKSTIEFSKAYDKADEYFEKLKEINKLIDKLIENATKKITLEVEVNTTNNYHTVYTEEGLRPPESSNAGDGGNGGDSKFGKQGRESENPMSPYYISIAVDNGKGRILNFDSEEDMDASFMRLKARFDNNVNNPSSEQYHWLSIAAFADGKRKKTHGRDMASGFITTMDTGGYTGQWYHSSNDPMMSGKLAMLHEKELVLNQEDTKNFLASIEMVRDLARIIDLQAASVGLRQLLEARFGFDAAQGELAQNIVIHADFPNATDHNEIMEAFETLADRAAQYANRADRTLAQAQETYNKAKLAL